MMNPTAELYATFFSCIGPVLVAMSGALLLGCLLGWLYGPGPKDGPLNMRKELLDLRKKLQENDVKLGLAGSIMVQRLEQQDSQAGEARKQLEREIAMLNARIITLKTGLVAAKRILPLELENAPRTVEKVVADPVLLSRIARLQKENARLPGLLKELDELRDVLAGEDPIVPKRTAPAPQALPDQVYRVMSTSFGRRIEQDDLELVEGIGPKIKAQFKKNGLKTWADVAAARPEQLKKVLDEAGERFQSHDPSSWPAQCRMMVENRWEELRKYQRKLSAAR